MMIHIVPGFSCALHSPYEPFLSMVIFSMRIHRMDHILFITIIGIMCHFVHSMISYPMSATFAYRIPTHHFKAANVLSLHSPFIIFLSTFWMFNHGSMQQSGFARLSWWVLLKLVSIVYQKCWHFYFRKVQKYHHTLWPWVKTRVEIQRRAHRGHKVLKVSWSDMQFKWDLILNYIGFSRHVKRMKLKNSRNPCSTHFMFRNFCRFGFSMLNRD